MRRIEIGQKLKTSYGSGPYVVLSIVRGCTCTHILDEIECIEKPLPPHVHMELRGVSDDHNKGERFQIGYYDESTLKSVAPRIHDKIILLENIVPIQTTLAI